MAAVTICSDFGAPQNKVSHCFHCFSIYLPWNNGTGCHDLSFLNFKPIFFNFKPTFSLPSFTFIKRLFSSSSLSVIKVLLSHYLKLLIFLLAILIAACTSSSLAFQEMYSAYKLNKQGGDIQPWHTPFTIYNQSVVPYPVLTVAFWPAYRKQVMWAGIPIFLKIFHSFVCLFVWSTQLKQSFKSILKETEVNVFLKFPCIFYDPLDVGSLISSSYAFSKPSLYIWKFLNHVVLNPCSVQLEGFWALPC